MTTRFSPDQMAYAAGLEGYLDRQASLDFLQLLCRLVAKRLREIDEKVTTWRIFVGPGDERVPV